MSRTHLQAVTPSIVRVRRRHVVRGTGRRTRVSVIFGSVCLDLAFHPVEDGGTNVREARQDGVLAERKCYVARNAQRIMVLPP